MSLADTAKSLIAKNGEPVTFAEPDSVAGFDPATGDEQVAVAGATHTVSGVPTQYKATEVDGERILSSDVRLIVGVHDFIPAVGWGCALEGRGHRVMDVQKTRQSGENMLLIVQLRAN